uniref:GATA-type domain-containing protein n=1 Tax=Aegilops tauschii subsp. strangulata TaxID=200361 RepID=A0A453FES7_AEGTS
MRCPPLSRRRWRPRRPTTTAATRRAPTSSSSTTSSRCRATTRRRRRKGSARRRSCRPTPPPSSSSRRPGSGTCRPTRPPSRPSTAAATPSPASPTATSPAASASRTISWRSWNGCPTTWARARRASQPRTYTSCSSSPASPPAASPRRTGRLLRRQPLPRRSPACSCRRAPSPPRRVASAPALRRATGRPACSFSRRPRPPRRPRRPWPSRRRSLASQPRRSMSRSLPSRPRSAPTAPSGVTAAANEGRRCLHCETDKTPQWRTGPMGPKTLCNACGVRYKSGRLVPEYRPAASPTFVMSRHSNSHRKVLELRRQREMHHHHQPSQLQQHAVAGGVGRIMHMESHLLFDGPAAPPILGGGDDFLIHHRLGTTDYRQQLI